MRNNVLSLGGRSQTKALALHAFSWRLPDAPRLRINKLFTQHARCCRPQEELPAGQEKEAKKGYKEEMRHAHQEQTAALDKHNHGPSNTAGMRMNMQMDSRQSRHGAE